MQPQQQYTPSPQYQPPQQASTPASNKKRTMLAIILLVGPTILFILTILISSIGHLLLSEATSSGSLFAEPSTGMKIVNVVTFVTAALSFLSWLPGMIIGIILLATKKK